MAKVPEEEAMAIFEEVASQPIAPSEAAYKMQSIEECRLATVKKLSEITDLAVETFVNIMENPEAKDGDKIKAATKVLEYTIGRPRETEHIDNASYDRKGQVGRVIIEGKVSEEAVREAIHSNFYGDGVNGEEK